MFKFKALYLAEVTVSFNLQLLHAYPRPHSTWYCSVGGVIESVGGVIESVGGVIDVLGGTLLHCERLSWAS